jgi:hypothetical protein
MGGEVEGGRGKEGKEGKGKEGKEEGRLILHFFFP